MASLPPAYRPRNPTATVLYATVREHLETFLSHARETYARPLPRYVEQEFRDYLRCGVFAHGFVHCACGGCGRELLVAFSCKRRGVCPSCAGRRMANAGAHLVDRVVPDVPLRQFVLSLPHELRTLAAFKPDVLTALSRMFADVVLASYRKRAERYGIDGGVGGSLTLIQRFGGSLNLNVHMHACFLDGVFTRDETGRVVFHALPKPEPGDLSAVVRRVHDRAVSWLRKHGYLDSSEVDDRPRTSDVDALEACAAIAMARGTFVKLVDAAPPAEAETVPQSALVTELAGFNLHAGVHIAAGDDMGRERLLRYGARPAFALDRLRRLPDGRITYKVKYARPRSKYRVMTPLELLARLASLIPPPRYPLLRFHGVLGPRSKWRKEVVPRPRDPASTCPEAKPSGRSTLPRPQTPRGLRTPSRGREAREHGGPSRAPITEAARSLDIVAAGRPKSGGAHPGPTVALHDLPQDASVTRAAHDHPRALLAPGVLATLVAPNVISVSHWNRLAKGELYAATRRVPWRELLRRTFDADVQSCAACGGRLRVIGAVVHPWGARRILERLGLPARAPPTARARDATELQGFEAAMIGDA